MSQVAVEDCIHVRVFRRCNKSMQILFTQIHKNDRLCNICAPDSLFSCDCSGKILNVEVVDGGLVCSSGVHVEEMGDKNDDCYIVNAAVYVGY